MSYLVLFSFVLYEVMCITNYKYVTFKNARTPHSGIKMTFLLQNNGQPTNMDRILNIIDAKNSKNKGDEIAGKVFEPDF